MSDEIGPQVPEGSGELPAVLEDGIQGDDEFLDLGLADHERRENF